MERENTSQNTPAMPAYRAWFSTPLGDMLAESDGESLTRLDFAEAAAVTHGEWDALPVFETARRWLKAYFSGQAPDCMPRMRLDGSPFQMRVWRMLMEIPYGETVTYGALAARMAAQDGGKRMAAQAVGGAVGHNPISILVPCHRVVGANGNLTGYGGGMERKVQLLALEGHDMARFTRPRAEWPRRLQPQQQAGGGANQDVEDRMELR